MNMVFQGPECSDGRMPSSMPVFSFIGSLQGDVRRREEKRIAPSSSEALEGGSMGSCMAHTILEGKRYGN
jgi:hypothetical protein